MTFITDEIQSTIGVDLDLWCYAKDMDNDNGSSNVAITFYAWDFAGQVFYAINAALHVI